ncbi:zinc finger protein 511-like [Glandiceps talaboti]
MDFQDGKEEQMQSHKRRVLSWSYKHAKRRLEPEDPFFEDGNLACCLLIKQISLDFEEQDDLFNSVNEFKCHEPGCHQFFTRISSYESHYNSKHRHVCMHCKRFFPSDHLLDIHVLEWHDALFQILAEKQNMYRCLIQSCIERFKTAKQRKNHLVKSHKYPLNFRFDKPLRKVKSAQSKSVVEVEPMDTASSKDIDGLTETMETVQVTPGTRIYKVPKTISFGRGVPRGFERTRQHSGHSQKQSQKKKKGPKYKECKQTTPQEDKMDT